MRQALQEGQQEQELRPKLGLTDIQHLLLLDILVQEAVPQRVQGVMGQMRQQKLVETAQEVQQEALKIILGRQVLVLIQVAGAVVEQRDLMGGMVGNLELEVEVYRRVQTLTVAAQVVQVNLL
jgi:hypothetical protein